MKKTNYINPTNIDGISNESVKAYFSVLYCEIIQPKTGAKVQRTGLLSKTHPIIGVANLMPMGAIDKSLKKRWEEIDKETDEIMRRVKNAPLQDRPIIMDNLVSALSLYDKIVKNMTEDPDEAIATCYPGGERIMLDVSRDPMGLRGVKAIVSRVMGEWRTFFVWAENTHYIYNIVEAEKHAAIQEPLKDCSFGEECSLNEEPQPTKPQEQMPIPTLYGTDREIYVYENALKKGYMSLTDGHYVWHQSKSLLGYMCGRLYCGDRIDTEEYEYKKGKRSLPARELKNLFGVDVANNRYQIGSPPTNYFLIDDLFKGASK